MLDKWGNEIPLYLQSRPQYKGYVITYVTMIGSDGVPDFRTLDMRKVQECFRNKRCGLCGNIIKDTYFAFIGGEKAAAALTFSDPPMHETCARYATKVCPFLNDAHASYAKHSRLKDDPEIVVTSTKIPGGGLRSRRMCLLLCTDYEINYIQGNVIGIARKRGSKQFWDLMPTRKE